MIISIHQPQYLPWLGYFDKMRRADVFVLLDNVQFKKNEWQNRNRIRKPDGWQWLTVPVRHDFGQSISVTRINRTQAWARKHIGALEANYRKAPYFDRYMPVLSEFISRDWDTLGDLNIALVRKVAELLGIKTRIELASAFEVEGHKTGRLVGLCRVFGADTYLSGEGGAHYLDMDLFRANNIEVVVQNYAHPTYNQLWAVAENGFIPCLSVVDLMFNCGPRSLAVLAKEGMNR